MSNDQTEKLTHHEPNGHNGAAWMDSTTPQARRESFPQPVDNSVDNSGQGWGVLTGCWTSFKWGLKWGFVTSLSWGVLLLCMFYARG